MSASHKKQLRKEQKAAQMTEKQLAADKEAKQLKLYTGLFIAVIALMVCVAVATTVISSGIIERNTTAVTVDKSKISVVELNYYYIDAINNFVESYGDYIAFSGLDTTKPLDQQVMNTETGATWANYFMDTATSNIHAVYAVYNKAIAEGCTLSEADEATLDSSMSYMEMYAMYSYGYTDLNSYLRAVYGDGANEASYRKYAEVQMIATNYANQVSESLTYTPDQIAAVLTEKPYDYTSYSYNYYYLKSSDFLQGGTTGEDGSVTYSDEEKAAALEACKTAAESLLEKDINSAILLDKALKELEVYAEKTSVTSTAIEDRMYGSVTAAMQEWIADPVRAAGDLTVLPNETKSTDADGNEVTTVNGYYVVLFNGSNDNTYMMNNVRHILIKFQGGTTGTDGTKTYTEEEKNATKAKAQEILDAYLAGEQTEEAFIALINAHSEDVDTAGQPNNGGLYENIIPSSNLVENFLNWAIDDARTPGETAIVETEYGYHIMYFVGDSELSYRDYMITNQLRSDDMIAWEDGLVAAAVLTVKNTSKVNTGLTLNAGV